MTDRTASTTASRDFFDANILVYAYNPRDPRKRAIAQRLLADAMANGDGALSAQVLGEFFNTATRRLPNPLSVEEALQVIEQISVLPVVALDLELVRQAVNTSQRYQISYWDALIIAAAEKAGCARLITEDLNAGQSYNGVVAFNPFRNAVDE